MIKLFIRDLLGPTPIEKIYGAIHVFLSGVWFYPRTNRCHGQQKIQIRPAF